MSNTVIKVENLGKKYLLNHQQEGHSQYRALRDVLSDGAKALGRRVLSPFGGSQDVHSSQEEFWALKDVSFEIKQGDRVGIIGRNGAGKSTLLKILSRITEPTTGKISIRGRVASLLEVGTGFHPELTGRENIYLNGAVLGMTKAEIKRKFDEIVDFAEVEKFLDTPVKRYSSGMYVRLAFAVAAHLEPEILVVDEVLAVGDAQFQKKCLGKMKEVGGEGRTVLIVSHNMETLTRLCNTALLLDNGAVKLLGSVDQAISSYLQSDYGTTAMRKWSSSSNAPGNKIVRLTKVEVHDENHRLADSFDITKRVGITMHYEVLEDKVSFTHGINLFNVSGLNILSSHDTTSDLRKKPRKKGHYSSTMWIPGNFLSEGNILVSVAILEQSPFVIHFHELDVVAFNIFDPMDGKSARGNYVGEFPGVVRPIFDWETAIHQL